MYAYLQIQRRRDQQLRENGLSSWFTLTAPTLGSPSEKSQSSDPPQDTDIAQSILDALRELDPSRQLTLLTQQTTTVATNQPPLASISSSSASSRPHDHDHDHDHHVRRLTADLSSPPSLRSAFAGQDLVISTQHAADYAQQTRLVNAAVQARVPRFMPCEFGQDALNERVATRLPPLAERARLIKFLRAMENEGPTTSASPPTTNGNGAAAAAAANGEAERESSACNGGCTHDHGHGHAGGEEGEEDGVEAQASGGFDDPFSWVAVAAGTLLDAGLRAGGGEGNRLGFDVKWQSATVHGAGGEAFAVSSLAWVGRLVARAVERWDWDGVRNRYLYAAGCVTTADEVVECLQRATAREWAVDRVGDVGECVREAEKRLAAGYPDAGMVLMERSVLYDTSLAAVDSFIANAANDLLGVGQEQVEDIVNGAVHDLQQRGTADCGCS